MKKIVLFSLLMVCLPFMALAQSGNDDLYYIPKKKKEKKEKVETKTVVKAEKVSVSGNDVQVTAPVVVRDVNGNTRDLDEYNRRYSSRENEFTYENDTLYIQEKPYLEQGEWVNGFQGSQEDYDYAMRIIRFRSPSFAVSVSSPYYWDIISLGYSANWNVFDTGLYAFAFPTYVNNWWWDWRYNSMFSIRYYPSSWLYRSHWYYSSNWWYGWGHSYPPHIHHSHWHHFPPHYVHGGIGGYWGHNHGWHGSSAHNPGIHAGRYTNNYGSGSHSGRNSINRIERASRNESVGNRRTSRNDQTLNRGNVGSVRSSSARVVNSRNSASSVRPQRSATKSRQGQAVSTNTAGGTRSTGVYTRQTQGKSSSYNRASSTRSTVNSSGSWGGRGGSGGSYSSGSSSSSGGSRSSSVSSSSSRSSSSGSYSSGGGGGRSASAGGTSRGSGGRR